MSPIPWKLIGAGLGALALVVALVWGANAALAGAKQAGRDEVQALWSAEKAGAAKAAQAVTVALSDDLSGLDKAIQALGAQRAAAGQAVEVRIKQEAQNDPRYTSVDCALTDGMRQQINAARNLSKSPAITGGGGVSVSTTATD